MNLIQLRLLKSCGRVAFGIRKCGAPANDLLIGPRAITSVRTAARRWSTVPCLIGSPRLRFQDDRSCPLSGSHYVMRLGAVSQVQDR